MLILYLVRNGYQTIIRTCGPRLFLIELADGREVRRYLDHIPERLSHPLTKVEEDGEDWVNTYQTHVPTIQPPPAGCGYNIQGRVQPQ